MDELVRPDAIGPYAMPLLRRASTESSSWALADRAAATAARRCRKATAATRSAWRLAMFTGFSRSSHCAMNASGLYPYENANAAGGSVPASSSDANVAASSSSSSPPSPPSSSSSSSSSYGMRTAARPYGASSAL